MASKFMCRCGEIVRTNLFEGRSLHLLVAEEQIDVSPSESARGVDSLLNKIVANSNVVAKCGKCGCIAIIDKNYDIKLYEPVAGS